MSRKSKLSIFLHFSPQRCRASLAVLFKITESGSRLFYFFWVFFGVGVPILGLSHGLCKHGDRESDKASSLEHTIVNGEISHREDDVDDWDKIPGNRLQQLYSCPVG